MSDDNVRLPFFPQSPLPNPGQGFDPTGVTGPQSPLTNPGMQPPGTGGGSISLGPEGPATGVQQPPILPEAPKPTGPPKSKSSRLHNTKQKQTDRELTISAAEGYAPLVYGTMRVAPKVFYVNVLGGLLYVAMAVAEGEIDSYVGVYFNSKLSTTFAGYVTMNTYTGSTTQGVDPLLSAAFGYTQKHPGLAYIVLVVTASAPFQGIPDVLAVIKGKKITDPRQNRVTKSEDFSAGAGWTSTGGAPTVTSGQTDEFGQALAYRLNFAGAGDWNLVVPATVGNAESWRGMFRVKASAGTPTVTFGLERGSGGAQVLQSASAALSASWQTIERMGTTNATDTNLRIRVVTSGAADVLIERCQVHKATEDTGYTRTTGTAIDSGTRYSSNPAIAIRDILTSYADAVATGADPDLDDPSFGRAAAWCDDQVDGTGTTRWHINQALTNTSSARGWIETIRGECAIDVVVDQGQYALLPDKSLDATPIALTDSHIADVKMRRLGAYEAPTRAVVNWVNPTKDYVQERAIAETTAVSTGAVPEEATIDAQGIIDLRVAMRLATYRLRRGAFSDIRINARVLAIAEKLKPGDLVSITWREILAAQQAILISKTDNGDGSFDCAFDEYDSSVYSLSSTATDTPPSTNIPSVSAGSLLDIHGVFVTGNNPLRVWWEKPKAWKAAELWDTTHWSHTGFVGFDGTKINNGTRTMSSGNAFYSTAGTNIVLDLGSGVTRKFSRACVTIGSYTFILYGDRETPAIHTVEYSDNGSSWTSVGTVVAGFHNHDGIVDLVIDWTEPAAAHRYWRITPSAYWSLGAFKPSELQYYEADGDATGIRGYILYNINGAAAQIGGEIPYAATPTSSTPLDLSLYGTYIASNDIALLIRVVPVDVYGVPRDFLDRIYRDTAPSIQNMVSVHNRDATGNIAAKVGARTLELYEDGSNGQNKVSLSAPAALAADYALTWPADDGAAGQHLETDGSGVLSWATPTPALPAGTVAAWTSISSSIPSGWLLCDGSAVSRSTYAALFAVLRTGAVVTFTNATDVVNWTAHGLSAGWPVKFSTAGTMPVGLSAGTTYYARDITSNSFKVAATPNGTAVGFSTDGSGTINAVCAPYGDGDGSTTFNVPDLQARFVLGKGTGANNAGGLGTSGGSFDHTHSFSDTSDAEPQTALKQNNDPMGVDLFAPSGHDHFVTGTTGTGNPPYLTTRFLIKT